MYLAIPQKSRAKDRSRSKRHRAKLKAKNRRRIQGMHGRRIGGRVGKACRHQK